VRRKNIYPHKSLRHMPFRTELLLQALLIAASLDAALFVAMPRILDWHSAVTGALLAMANVPWQYGRTITLIPGITASLLHTNYLSYDVHPWMPIGFTGAAVVAFICAYKYVAAPLKPLLLLVPLSLGGTLLFLKFISPNAPYSPEEFCAIWYRGEAYLWLLLPFIFGMGFFILDVPLALKLRWLFLLLGYSFIWSVVRLAVALATFHYLGSIWMPLFYFAFGFLADFLYIVAFYSLAMDRAATFLARRREVWL
jgi:hypothetical protein